MSISIFGDFIWSIRLVARVARGMGVLVSLEGGLLLLDNISNGGVGGQLVHIGLHSVLEGVLEGGECRRRSPQSLLSDGHLYSNPLGLAVQLIRLVPGPAQ